MMYNRFSRSRYPEQIGLELPIVQDEAERTMKKTNTWEPPSPPTFQLQSMNRGWTQ
jgi:hypothetical protein